MLTALLKAAITQASPGQTLITNHSALLHFLHVQRRMASCFISSGFTLRSRSDTPESAILCVYYQVLSKKKKKKRYYKGITVQLITTFIMPYTFYEGPMYTDVRIHSCHVTVCSYDIIHIVIDAYEKALLFTGRFITHLEMSICIMTYKYIHIILWHYRNGSNCF